MFQVLSGGTEDSGPHLATPTNEENEKGGWGLPGKWGIFLLPRSHRSPWWPGLSSDPLSVNGWSLVLLACLWECGDLPSRYQGWVSSAVGMGSLVMFMDGDGGKGSPKLPLAPAMDLYYMEAG